MVFVTKLGLLISNIMIIIPVFSYTFVLNSRSHSVLRYFVSYFDIATVCRVFMRTYMYSYILAVFTRSTWDQSFYYFYRSGPRIRCGHICAAVFTCILNQIYTALVALLNTLALFYRATATQCRFHCWFWRTRHGWFVSDADVTEKLHVLLRIHVGMCTPPETKVIFVHTHLRHSVGAHV